MLHSPEPYLRTHAHVFPTQRTSRSPLLLHRIYSSAQPYRNPFRLNLNSPTGVDSFVPFDALLTGHEATPCAFFFLVFFRTLACSTYAGLRRGSFLLSSYPANTRPQTLLATIIHHVERASFSRLPRIHHDRRMCT